MKPEQILVVDDEKRLVDSIAKWLTSQGFRVFCAYGGLQAIRLFNTHKFDLVLLDISMPDMNGYEAMAKMFELDTEILVIIMTGFASVESAVSALKQGAWDYLKKPFEYADLIKTVKNGLAQRNLIAQKKIYAARLEASEKKYQYMIDNSPDLIFTLDENFCFSFANQQFQYVLGYLPLELTGTPFDTILHEDDRGKLSRLFQADGPPPRDLSPGSSMALNLRFKKADDAGETEYNPNTAFTFMEMKASVLTLPDIESSHDFDGIYAVARDVTERVRLETQLRQAQKMEAIGTLAGGIAHDFNNILMSIQGYTSLVKIGFNRESEAYKRLSNIDEYVHNGAEMARQLLDFSRKNNRQAAITLNINYLLKTSAKMFGRTRKDIMIHQELDKNLWLIKVDESQIKQVLMNLFVNAWHAMPKGGRIVVKSQNVVMDREQAQKMGLDQAGDYIKVCVADTGTGMDKQTLSRIFDPFFTTKDRGQGTGLGLSTAYGIIKAHKGTFQVDSSPGKGSVFMFFLPAIKDRTYTNHVLSSAKNSDRLISGKGRVLLVDDEKEVIEVCKEMLETLGYEVLVAGAGAQAVSVVQNDTKGIDLMILDVVMPGMDGVQTYDAVRHLNPDIRVLVCSGLYPKQKIRQMINNECRDFLLKPFDIAKLSEKIESVFSA
ncbi:hybrid sensor histidine kinase/response regulator [Desulfobacter latus]|uniref:histidine kinase n=1 Tax=Desulfobacter latus TaxID=2292 RepID=A0A850SZE5_9BACT|nr:response regulator [Desulfobacter latus]NWH06674.1 response regulator [Desulfobacter latus]